MVGCQERVRSIHASNVVFQDHIHVLNMNHFSHHSCDKIKSLIWAKSTGLL
jgi:hypothetical protein